jgi:secreted PhoX family phosphatase
MDRRTFLKVSAGTAGLATVAGPFQGLLAHAAGATGPEVDLGPLRPAPDRADGLERLTLPAGYTYKTLSAVGDVMSDGVATPGFADGMAAFRGPRGTVRVVRNHEVNGAGTPMGDAAKAYDAHTLGGTTTFQVSGHNRNLDGHWVSLNGTSFNCAGGPTPWGTWMSVEETVNGPDVGRDFAGQGNTDFGQRHGYMFEVDSRWGPGEHRVATPIRNIGRLPHEAAAVDPFTGFVYQTEDQFLFPAGIYRYRPPRHPLLVRRILDGGVLEMLRIRGATSPTVLGGRLDVGSRYDIDWVRIPQPDFDGGGRSNNDAIRTVSLQGFAQNAAMFARPEGLWYHAGAMFFSCTRGGGDTSVPGPLGEYGTGNGQIWRLDLLRRRLTLLFQSSGPAELDLPDNLTVTPHGSVVICEDGLPGNFIRILTRHGHLVNFAENITGRPQDEFAGVTISPDNRTMFVNIQSDAGRTFAIWKERGGLGF